MDMAALMGMMSQGGSKGPDPASADDPSVQMGRLFPPMDHLSPEEKAEAMEAAFNKPFQTIRARFQSTLTHTPLVEHRLFSQ